MGVLACDRKNCPNVMCDRIIMDKYYICDTCFDELLGCKRYSWSYKMSKADVSNKITEFMCSEPGTYIQLKGSEIDEEFERLVKSR